MALPAVGAMPLGVAVSCTELKEVLPGTTVSEDTTASRSVTAGGDGDEERSEGATLLLHHVGEEAWRGEETHTSDSVGRGGALACGHSVS